MPPYVWKDMNALWLGIPISDMYEKYKAVRYRFSRIFGPAMNAKDEREYGLYK